MALLDDLVTLDEPRKAGGYTGMIVDAARRFGVPEELALRVHLRGEQYDPSNPTSPKGATGPMQLMPGTFKDVGAELGYAPEDISDPEKNIQAGVYYLGQQLKRFRDPVLAAAAYNAGPGAVEKAGGIPPFTETISYLKRIFGPSEAQAAEIPPVTGSSRMVPAVESGYEVDVYSPGKRETAREILGIPSAPSVEGTQLTRGGGGEQPEPQEPLREPTWWDTVGQSIRNVPNVLAAEAGGAMQGFSKATFGEQPGSGWQQFGQSLVEKYGALARENAPDVDPMSAKGLVNQAITGVGAMTPALVAGAITGNPLVAAGIMGLQSFGGAYPQQAAGGQSPEDAGMAAMATAAADAIPAIVPVKVLLEPGMNFFKRLAISEVTVPAQQMLSEALKLGVEKGTIAPDMTWNDARTRLVQSGLVAGITAPFMAGVTQGTRVLLENAPLLQNERGSVRLPGMRQEPNLTQTVNDPAVYRQKMLSQAQQLLNESQAAQFGKYIDSINVERLETEDQVNQVMQAISQRIAPAIQQQRRGKMSFEDIQEAANRSGLDAEKLMAMGKGTALNAEHGLAARMLNAASADYLFGMRQKVLENAAQGVTDDNVLLDFHKALQRHQMIQAAESGIATEAGRALSARRILVSPEAQKIKNVKAMLDSLGGEKMTVEIAKKLAEIDPADTFAVNKFIRDATKATTFDKLYELWMNALLSSPTTHAANILGNTLTFFTRYPEKLGAATVEGLKSALTGKPSNRLFGEVAQDLVGATVGLPKGLKAAWQTFLTEMPSDAESKLETVTGRQAIKGRVGQAVRLPSRFLLAADEFFKAINFSGELYSQAFRQATNEGVTGTAKGRRIQQLVNGEGGKASEAIYEAAAQDAKYRTFQQDLSGFMRNISLARNDPSLPSKLMSFVVPFVKTPVNVVKYGLERTALSFLHVAAKAIQKDLKPGQAADEVARALMGSVVMGVFYSLAQEGLVTGAGPDQKNKKDAFYRTGRQPYSVRIGDTWYSYQRFEPIASIVGMAADFSESFDHMTEEEKTDAVSSMIRSTKNLFVSKTWMKGVSLMLDAIDEPERKGTAWVASLAGTIIPTGVAAYSRGTDPYLRDTKRESALDEIGARIQSRIPGLAENLPRKIDVFGEPVEKAGGFVTRFLIPAPGSPAKKDAINEELYRLRELVAFNPIPRSYKVRGQEVTLTPAQYEELSILTGKEARKRLEGPMSTQAFARMPDERKAEFIRGKMEDAREAIRSQYLRKIGKGL